MYLIGDNLCQVKLLLGTVSECLSKNSGHKDGSHSNETISPEGLDHQQLVQGLANRSCRKKYTMSVIHTNTHMYMVCTIITQVGIG